MAELISPEARQDLLQRVADWCAQQTDISNLDQAEERAEQTRQIVGEAVLAASLKRLSGKPTYQGAHLTCPCGAQARFVGYRPRWIKSLCGEVLVERAYYHCSLCQRGHLPWDQAQGLSEKVFTLRFKASVCQVMGRLSYTQGVALLFGLLGVSLAESSAEAIVLEVGERIRKQQAKQIQQVQALTEQATAQRLFVQTPPDPKEPALPLHGVDGKRLYVGVDATTAHIDGEWRNVQNGLVFTVEADAKGRDTLKQRAYVAGRMDMQSLGWQMRRLSTLWQEPAYPEVVFLADGAPCNWNLAATHFVRAVCILDFYHASQPLWELSRLLYRQDDSKDKARGERWVKKRLESLKTQGPKPLLCALKRRQGPTKEVREALRKAGHYFQENACRMDYPAHLLAGRMIGSGAVEAECKCVVGMRLKQAGMRWSDKGADAVLAVRTSLLNKETDKLFELARAA
ncbi:MAG TPA: ISKra4 family transposase [Chthonomonadaceae bacterium]|nr:ISKra4 family transposase [Chthonomonadaceae bacterium]